MSIGMEYKIGKKQKRGISLGLKNIDPTDPNFKNLDRKII